MLLDDDSLTYVSDKTKQFRAITRLLDMKLTSI